MLCLHKIGEVIGTTFKMEIITNSCKKVIEGNDTKTMKLQDFLHLLVLTAYQDEKDESS